MRLITHAFITICLGWVFVLPATAHLTEEEQQNRDFVMEFWRVVLQAGHLDRAGEYYAVDMIQHNPNVPQGLAGFVEFFSRLNREPQEVQPTIQNMVEVTVEDDLVTIIRRADVEDPEDSSRTYDAFNFDTFRVRNGKIVEHWDAARRPTPE